MKRSKPSTVVGGGEMKRATSSVVSSAKSDGASDARSSRSVTVRAGQHRQPVAPVVLTVLDRGRRWAAGNECRVVQLRRKASFP